MLSGAKKLSRGCGMRASFCFYFPAFVIASAAKQSIHPRKRHGFLRRFAPRNDGSCRQAKIHAADGELIAGHLVILRPRRITHLRYIADPKIEAAHDVGRTFDKAERAVRQLELGHATRAAGYADTD